MVEEVPHLRDPRPAEATLSCEPALGHFRSEGTSVRNFGRLLRYMRLYWKRLLMSAVCLTAASLLGLVLPWVLRSLIDSVLVGQDFSLLNRIVGGLVVVFIVQMVFGYTNGYLLAWVGERVVADLRAQLYRHLLRLSLRFFSERRVGEIMSRVTNDVSLIQTAVANNFVGLIQQAVTLVGGIVMLVVVNWRLTVLTLTVAPVVITAVFFFSRKLRRISIDVQDRLADVATVLEETLSGVRIVKSFTREDHEVERFTRRVERNFRTAMRRAQARAIFLPLITFLAFLALSAVLWYGGNEVIAGRITPGDLVAFLFYAVIVAGPIGASTGLYAQFQEALGATERVFQLLDEQPELTDVRGALPMPPIKGQVHFEDVSFDYDPRDEVLRDIRLIVNPGEIVALVGPSGAGKSTLVNLIPRFYDPDKGRILIDGLDIRTVRIKSLREQIGIVPQETILFGGSVRENISYGKLDASDREIVAAARAANAHDFVAALPNGYHTIVGERGAKLSGGERQRISIARAILKDPRILILDEATSSLDTESERLVQEALDRLMHGRTTFVIAHRLSTVNNANVIIYLADGRIMERGTHQELMARKGRYHRLYSMQFTNATRGEQTDGATRLDGGEEQPESEERDHFTLLSEWSRRNPRH